MPHSHFPLPPSHFLLPTSSSPLPPPHFLLPNSSVQVLTSTQTLPSRMASLDLIIHTYIHACMHTCTRCSPPPTPCQGAWRAWIWTMCTYRASRPSKPRAASGSQLCSSPSHRSHVAVHAVLNRTYIHTCIHATCIHTYIHTCLSHPAGMG